MTDAVRTTVVNGMAVNLYDELGLNRDDNLQRLRDALELQKPQWLSKRGRAGKVGESARNYLQLIEAAEAAFADEDSRESYDLSLVRRSNTAVLEEVEVNWLGRAWSYYFVQDFGAAGVAARKAREQTPESAMPYVVSAWINLAEGELRRAKQDADEAFVLDELGEDTADVQQVRGQVFYEQGNFDRAIQSFDRAFAKASEHERADLLRRKAWALEYQGNGKEALEAALEGLELVVGLPGGEVPLPTLQGLTAVVARCCDYLAGTLQYPGVSGDEKAPPPQQIIGSYRQLKERVRSSAMPSANLDEVTKHIDDRVAVEELRVRMNSLEQMKDATGAPPGFPIKSIGGGIFLFLLGFAWPGFFIGTLALFGWAAYCFTERSRWQRERTQYADAQRDLESTGKKWEKRRNAIEVAATPIPMAYTDPHGR